VRRKRVLLDREATSGTAASALLAQYASQSDQGDTFSLGEISAWLSDAGFRDIRTVEAPGLAPRIILATK